MKTNIEIKGLYAHAAAILGIAAGAFFPVTSAYAHAAPEIQAVNYEDSTTVNVDGVNFGSTPGTLAIGGAVYPVISWTPTNFQVAVSLYSGGDWSVCLWPGASFLVKMTTSASQGATATFSRGDTTLASSMTHTLITITNVKINGGGSSERVSPGATFTMSANYNILDNGCPNL
jgi:hypothetical protein